MGKKLQIKISIGIMCCLVALIAGCNKVNEPTESDNATEPRGIEESHTYSFETESAEHRDTEADLPLESETPESMNHKESETSESMNDDTGHEYVGTRYYCLEADDPKVQEYIIGDAGEDGFVCGSFIKGLAGFSPESDSSGGITYYTKDKEIIIEKNVGQGLLQSQRLAEVKENIREMVMDIIRERGRNVSDYQEYFAEEVLLQQIEAYLGTEVDEDWLLLETFYLSWYAGNTENIYWYNKSETTWRDFENEVTKRLTETDTMYHFEYEFYADYRTMEYGEYDKAAAIYFTCAVSKETGLIEEISISKFYTHRFDFETMRWT